MEINKYRTILEEEKLLEAVKDSRSSSKTMTLNIQPELQWSYNDLDQRIFMCLILIIYVFILIIMCFSQVHVGGEEYVHLRVFKSLPHAGEKLQVHGVKTSKTHNEPISYF
uniref:Uncharacterized protein n=1 Tax=Astyanax mexicanus TaxID=7994 RepID=A0A3B1IEV0_ASTMX